VGEAWLSREDKWLLLVFAVPEDRTCWACWSSFGLKFLGRLIGVFRLLNAEGRRNFLAAGVPGQQVAEDSLVLHRRGDVKCPVELGTALGERLNAPYLAVVGGAQQRSQLRA
jgi:hypothetical protein